MLTSERRFLLIPAVTIVRSTQHREFPTRGEQDLNLSSGFFEWSCALHSDNHYTKVPQYLSFLTLSLGFWSNISPFLTLHLGLSCNKKLEKQNSAKTREKETKSYNFLLVINSISSNSWHSPNLASKKVHKITLFRMNIKNSDNHEISKMYSFVRIVL